MNPEIALQSDFELSGQGEKLAFLSFASKKAKQQLSGSAEEAVKNIAVILDQLLVAAIERRTAPEFMAVRDAAFPNYVGVMISLSTLIRSTVRPQILDSLTMQSLCEQESEFRDHALPAFGSAIRDQAIFTVWTLRKINDLAQSISKTHSPLEAYKDREPEMLRMFTFHGLRTRFHLDCLTASMHHKKHIFPEVLSAISNGLRSAVDAYAWIREIHDCRYLANDPPLTFMEMDDEDRLFVDASEHDMVMEHLAE